MKLSAHFSMDEFCASDTATRLRINNDLPLDMLIAAYQTAQMLEKIREFLGHPIIVTSGYRSLALNRAIASSDSSDHIKAMAADFKCPGFGSPLKVAQVLGENMQNLGIGQLIYEFGSWVHVSTRAPAKSINRLLTINSSGTVVGIA